MRFFASRSATLGDACLSKKASKFERLLCTFEYRSHPLRGGFVFIIGDINLAKNQTPSEQNPDFMSTKSGLHVNKNQT